MRRIKLVASLFLPLLLAACWVGGVWYDAADSAAVVAPGEYRLVEPGASLREGDIISITRNRDGSLTINAKNPWRILTIPFGPEKDRRYIIQAQQMDRTFPRALYMLMAIREGRTLINILPCDGAAQEAVGQSGGSVSRDPSSAPSCTFPDKHVFETQLQAFIARADLKKPDLELVPVVH